MSNPCDNSPPTTRSKLKSMPPTSQRGPEAQKIHHMYAVSGGAVIVWAAICHAVKFITLWSNLLLLNQVTEGHDESGAAEVVARAEHRRNDTQVRATSRKQVRLKRASVLVSFGSLRHMAGVCDAGMGGAWRSGPPWLHACQATLAKMPSGFRVCHRIALIQLRPAMRHAPTFGIICVLPSLARDGPPASQRTVHMSAHILIHLLYSWFDLQCPVRQAHRCGLTIFHIQKAYLQASGAHYAVGKVTVVRPRHQRVQAFGLKSIYPR